MFGDYLFTCSICERDIHDIQNRSGRDRHIAPVCRYCESNYADRPPTAGAFMDRRMATQISALANALNGKAHTLQWEARHGRS